MILNTDYYKYLLVVEDCGSIRQAAELLHMKQQNLSSMIRNIEHYYDITIFERSSKGVHVTEDGAFFLKEARALLEIADRMESPYLYPSKRYYSQIVDSVDIYCSGIIGSHTLVSVMNQFRERFPYVNVNFLTRKKEEMITAQAQDVKSVGLLITANPIDQLELEMPETLNVQPFVRMPVFAATTEDNPEAQQLAVISMQELLKKKLVLFSQVGMKETFIYELLCKYGKPDIQHVVDNVAIFLDLLRQNHLWTACTSEQARQNNLRAIPFQEDCRVQSYILYHKDAAEDIVMKNLLKLLSQCSYGREKA